VSEAVGHTPTSQVAGGSSEAFTTARHATQNKKYIPEGRPNGIKR